MYLFVDSTRETFDRNIEFIISLSSLPRWYDAVVNEPAVTNEKATRGASVSVEKLASDLHQAKFIGRQSTVVRQEISIWLF